MPCSCIMRWRSGNGTVYQFRKKRRLDLPIRRPLQAPQNRGELVDDLLALLLGRQRPPRLPVKAEELMECMRAFKGERNRGKFSQRAPLQKRLWTRTIL